MLLTKEQISEQMRKHAEKKNGLHDLMEIMLESMMVAERCEFLAENPGNKGNGYRPGKSYGQGKNLSSVSHATATATSIRRFWLSCGTRRRSATGWPEFFIPKGSHRSRSAMCSPRYTVSITPSQASAAWLSASALRSTNGLKEGLRSTIQWCSWTACISRFTASVRWQARRSMWRWLSPKKVPAR